MASGMPGQENCLLNAGGDTHKGAGERGAGVKPCDRGSDAWACGWLWARKRPANSFPMAPWLLFFGSCSGNCGKVDAGCNAATLAAGAWTGSGPSRRVSPLPESPVTVRDPPLASRSSLGGVS